MHSTQASHGSSHIAAAQAMMTNLHTASWHHCCRGTWHQTSHDQWPTLTGDLETAQWLGSSTPTAVNVNNSTNICGKSHWTECCFCKQYLHPCVWALSFSCWWGGKCCGLWSITGDHQLRHMAWAWCSRAADVWPLQPAAQFYREIETWASTLYCVMWRCRHPQFWHWYVHIVHQYTEKACLQNLYIWVVWSSTILSTALQRGSLWPRFPIAGVEMEEPNTKC